MESDRFRRRKQEQGRRADFLRVLLVLLAVLVVVLLVVVALVLYRDQAARKKQDAKQTAGQDQDVRQAAGREQDAGQQDAEQAAGQELDARGGKAGEPEQAEGKYETVIDEEDASAERVPIDAAEQSEDGDASGSGTAVQQVNIRKFQPGDVLSEEDLAGQPEKFFKAYRIGRKGGVFARINGRSYRDNPNIALSDLRYLRMLHYNFDHEIQVGEMVCNKAIAKDVLAIFRELFEEEYEVQSMYLIDNYWTGDGDSTDTASIDVNNTSCFCYREVTGGSKLSNHAYGRAIDINPQQNPYIWQKNGQWHWTHRNADPFIDRSGSDPHMVKEGDVCFNIFAQHGFSWGGNWSNPIDYQHFEKKG